MTNTKSTTGVATLKQPEIQDLYDFISTANEEELIWVGEQLKETADKNGRKCPDSLGEMLDDLRIRTDKCVRYGKPNG